MLQPDTRFALSELPGIQVYRDDRIPGGFYAFPAVPRVARDAQGQPEFNLTLYGRKERERITLQGGLLGLTVGLAVTPQEERLLLEGVRRYLAAHPIPETSGPALPPQRLSADWLAGEVGVRLTQDIELHGKPSLFADNRCAMSRNLRAETAESLLKAWKSGLPRASVRYSLTLRPAPETTRIELQSRFESTDAGGAGEQSASLDLRGSTTRSGPSGPAVLILEGPLAFDAGELVQRLQTIEL